MKLCVIPARGGSKRIPRKNIRPFCGKPMIAWSIAAARDSGLFDRVAVSTDDAEIADVAARWGAEVPFLRPAELSDDHVGTGPVMLHALQWHADHGLPPALACCLYATAPFVTADDLRAAADELAASGAAFVFTATSFPFPVLRGLRRTAGGGVAPMFPEHIGRRSQDLPEAFHDAGQFYVGHARDWLAGRPMFGPDSRMHLLPRHRVQDIDTEEDWLRAEWLFRAQQEAAR